MQRIETTIPDVFLIEPKVFEDPRGFFMETFHAQKFAELGIETSFVQDNHSKSGRGTLRGLHFQLKNPQAKLCRVVQGEVLDVAVDIRRSSPTFGKWISALLSQENKRQIWVPRGFAHGFVVLSHSAEFLYKCDNLYDPQDERGIAWNDAQIGINWELNRLLEHSIESPLLSNKDKDNPTLAQIAPEDLPLYSP